jgi:hypothetical protein
LAEGQVEEETAIEPLIDAPLDPSGSLAQATDALEEFESDSRLIADSGGVLSQDSGDPPITLFDTADLLTGPASSIQQGLSGTAFIGQFVRAPEVRKARRFLESFKQDFVRILQNNPRYPVSEREAILQSLNLESSFMGEPLAFQDDLIGLDDFLAVREENARATVENGTVGRDEREQALNVLNAIGRARMIIGAPPRMESREDVEIAIAQGRLAPGKLFRVPDGRILRVPNPQGLPNGG